jgi:DNA-binding transcriptional ArsR family regulator
MSSTSGSRRIVRDRSSTDQTRERLRDALCGTRGGRNRRRLLRALSDRPRNANRLAELLSLDYKTVRYHLSVLAEAGAVDRGGDHYGAVYVPSERARRHWDLVEAATDGEGSEDPGGHDD